MLRRATLFLLVAATALPFVVFSSVMVVLFSRQQQETIEQTLTQTARTAIDFVDREIASPLGALETLAASDYLVDHDLASRPDERRGGRQCVRKCGYGWSQ